MKKLVILIFLLIGLVPLAWSQTKRKKLSKDEMSKLTPDQRMTYTNRRAHPDGSTKESVKKKVKRAKKVDRQSRRMKRPRK